MGNRSSKLRNNKEDRNPPPWEIFWTNAGYNNIAEEIIENLDFATIVKLRLVSKSCKFLLDKNKKWWTIVIGRLKMQPRQEYDARTNETIEGSLIEILESYPHLQEMFQLIEEHVNTDILKKFATAIYNFITKEDNKITAPMFFVKEEYHPIIEALFYKGFELDTFMSQPLPRSQFHLSFIQRAARMGNLKSLSMVLQNSNKSRFVAIDVDSNSRTILQNACLFAQYEIVDYLLDIRFEYDIGFSTTDIQGMMALHLVCYDCTSQKWKSSNSIKIVKRMLIHAREEGTINVVDNYGRTPFFSACMGACEGGASMDNDQIRIHSQVMQEFFNHHDIVDFHMPGTWNGKTISPFYLAIEQNMPWLVRLFFENSKIIGLNLTEVNENGVTPLEFALKALVFK